MSKVADADILRMSVPVAQVYVAVEGFVAIGCIVGIECISF